MGLVARAAARQAAEAEMGAPNEVTLAPVVLLASPLEVAATEVVLKVATAVARSGTGTSVLTKREGAVTAATAMTALGAVA
eukprot:scaffold139675_cov23-Tisochrysis_lutea.AAC.1